MKIEKVCHHCGKSYFVNSSQASRSKFCSDSCFRASKKKQIEYRCDFCGKSFMVHNCHYEALLRGDKKHLFCSKECAQNFQKPKWEDIQKLFKSYNFTLISDSYNDCKKKLQYICNKHKDKGVQEVTYNNLKNGCGCKYCGDERTQNARRLTFDSVRNIFAKHDMILLEQPYHNTSEPMAYICKHHKDVGVQYMTTSNAYKQHCPYCHIYKGEDKILKYFINNNIEFESQKKFPNLTGIKGGQLSFDFFLPKLNILVEYQGKQHESPIDIFGGNEQFKIQQEHDLRKREYAKSNNIQLVEIWYYDLNNIEEILKERININNFESSETAGG